MHMIDYQPDPCAVKCIATEIDQKKPTMCLSRMRSDPAAAEGPARMKLPADKQIYTKCYGVRNQHGDTSKFGKSPIDGRIKCREQCSTDAIANSFPWQRSIVCPRWNTVGTLSLECTPAARKAHWKTLAANLANSGSLQSVKTSDIAARFA